MGPVHVFLSHAPEDGAHVENIARHLVPLREHDVHLHHLGSVLPGAEEARTRTQQLDRSQIVLLLVSPDALASERCQAEWQRALERRAAGHAAVIPVLLRPAYAAGAPFTALAALPADGKPISTSSHPEARLAELARAVHDQAQQIQDTLPARPTQSDLPLPPPHAAYDPSWYVVRPECEVRGLDGMAYAGMAVLLYGPERCGKTWMLRHLIHRTRQPGDRVVVLNLDLCEPAALASLPAFLRELALQIGDALALDRAVIEGAFARPDTPKGNLDWLMRRHLLPRDGGRLLLCIDRADAALAAPYRDSFFGLLRGWADAAADEPFCNLRMALCVSTTPQLLIQGVHLSPFNVADAIELSDLSPPQSRELLLRHGLLWSDEELDAARRLVGGHPYLLRVLMYAARRQGRPVAALLADESVFAAHLSRYRRALHREPALQRALRAAADGAAVGEGDEDQDALQRLRAAGLIGGPERRPVLRCELYRRLLPAV